MENTETLQSLLFRRQFLLGPAPFIPSPHWSSIPLNHGLHLSVHRDIGVFSESQDGVIVALIGLAIDSLHPESTMSDIARSLIRNASEIRQLIDCTASLAGRWVIVFQDQKGTYLFTDPCGFRQVFYHLDTRDFWCGSQPEIINEMHKLDWDTDEELLRFLMSPELSQTESAWVGARTLYKNCFHLLPNHYLDVNRLEQIRFYPIRMLPEKDTSEIVKLASSILQNTIEAIAKRHDVLFALTAGWDSRVLLAASRHVSQNMEYFIDRQGVISEDSPDVWVPSLLAKRLGINFTIRNSAEDLPGWFVSLISRNVTGARILPKSRMIYSKYITAEKRININGNAGEICRNYFDERCKLDPKDVSTADLARSLGYNNSPFVLQEIDEWRNGLCSQGVNDVNILDMLYWEQRLGNWGAQYPAEQDIAIDEISPFNCRLLIETLLSSPRRLRAAPDFPLYKELIENMWPEALSVPINPAPKTRITSPIMKLLKRGKVIIV